MASPRNRQLPPPVEPDLPALDPASQNSINNSLADVDSNYVPTMSDDSLAAPEDVVNDVAQSGEVRRAEPNLKPTGAFMDVSFIQQLNNASDEEFNAMYDALDPALQHVYDRSYNMEVSPKWAADTAQDFYRMQDERQKMAADPVRQEQTRKLKTEADIAEENRMRAMQKTLDTASYMDDLLEKVKTHPGRQYATGKSSILPKVPGTEPANFQVLLDQLQGQQFMQAYETLKGGGQITEVEGRKATEAMARMNPRQSEEAFLQGVNEFQSVVRSAKERAATKIQPADSPSTPAAQSAAPRQRKTVAGTTYEKGADGRWYQVR
jgi:hypothetical protein